MTTDPTPPSRRARAIGAARPLAPGAPRRGICRTGRPLIGEREGEALAKRSAGGRAIPPEGVSNTASRATAHVLEARAPAPRPCLPTSLGARPHARHPYLRPREAT